ncbi:MAG: type II secretion system GspH family protein [Akkermansiaceae bacterium]|nr:type II secretion system GspH family protein [Akkermansiaceae bacterium]
MKARKSGFTLVELLVAIVIVSILSLLAFFGVRSAKERASAAVDANDMRNIWVGVQSFTADNNGKLPTTMSGISPTYRRSAVTLSTVLAPYLGFEDATDGQFMPVFAAASWQSATNNPTGPSLLVHQEIYVGKGKKWTGNPMRPSPSQFSFGYPGSRAPRTMAAVMGAMSYPADALMLSEIDRKHPEFKVSKPSWLADVPENLAHGSYRLGLYWDGHVGKLDEDLKPK